MFESLFALLPVGLAVDQITVETERVVVTAHVEAAAAACPLCYRPSCRVHSRYYRRLGDLPWQGRGGDLHLLVRRFRCTTADCPRRIFAEPLPAVARPRVRRTVRLADTQRRLALSLGGEPAARLAAHLAMPVSGGTLLRLIREVPLSAVASPRVIGIDDWAWRRGKRYGTLIVDLEHDNRPIDVLPDRQAETVADWLKTHPGVEIVARDRAGASADGIRQGAPEAIQVADRWHLLRNLSTALAEALTGRQRDLQVASRLATAPPTTGDPPEEPSPEPARLTRREQRCAAIQADRQARYAEVVALHERGWSQTGIAATLGLDRKTVRVWLRAGQPPSWRQPPKGSVLDPFSDHLRRRWDEGCRNAAHLWREIHALGFSGGRSVVRDWVRTLRPDGAKPASIAPAPMRPPSRRRAAWLVLADADEINETERAFPVALVATAPDLGPLIALGRAFRAMVRGQRAGDLDGWLSAAADTALSGFADGVKRDLAAVRAALSLPWSTGPAEGHISRLKTIKRTMNGRAGFALLRHRVLEAA